MSIPYKIINAIKVTFWRRFRRFDRPFSPLTKYEKANWPLPYLLHMYFTCTVLQLWSTVMPFDNRATILYSNFIRQDEESVIKKYVQMITALVAVWIRLSSSTTYSVRNIFVSYRGTQKIFNHFYSQWTFPQAPRCFPYLLFCSRKSIFGWKSFTRVRNPWLAMF